MKVNKFILIATLLLAGRTMTGQRPVTAGDSLYLLPGVSLRESLDKADSLQRLWPYRLSDTSRVNLLIEMAGNYSTIFYDSAVACAERALQLAARVGYRKGQVMSLLKRGYAEELLKRNWDAAILFYRKAIEIAREHRLNGMMDDLFSIIHNAYVYQGNFPMAMSIAREGLERATRSNNRHQMLHYTSLVAASYFRQDLYPQALQEYRRAEILANDLHQKGREWVNLVTLADVYLGLGNVYAAEGDHARALQYLDKAEKEFRLLETTTPFKRYYMIPNILYKKGLVYRLSGNNPVALQHALAALNACKKASCNPYEKAEYYLLAGDVYRLMRDYQPAESCLYEGKRIAREIRHAENARDAYRYLSLYFADRKRFDSAWWYNQQYTVLRDSIINERTRFRTEEINALYGIAEKDRLIARQNNLRGFLIAAFLLLLLTLGFLYNRYRLRQRHRYQQALNRQQNELFNAISLAQEQERKRIAQDLHDSLGSVLSAAKLKLAELKENRPDISTDEKFQAGIGLLNEAAAELRNISHNIMPATLSKLGLVPALKNLSEKISSGKGLQVYFMVHGMNERLNEQTEISVYRIVLELVNNVVKHAGATKATVQLVRFPGQINITVEDNGIGFDTGRMTEERTGIGLGNVAARVEYLRGTLDIDSSPGKGTTVIVDIPLA